MLSAHSTNKFKELNTKNERKKIRQTHLQRLGDFFPVFFYTNTSRSPITKISDFSALIKLRQMEFMRERCSFIKFYIDGTLNERQQCAPAKSMQLCKFFINLAQHKRKQRQKNNNESDAKNGLSPLSGDMRQSAFFIYWVLRNAQKDQSNQIKGNNVLCFFYFVFRLFQKSQTAALMQQHKNTVPFTVFFRSSFLLLLFTTRVFYQSHKHKLEMEYFMWNGFLLQFVVHFLLYHAVVSVWCSTSS